MVKRGERTGKDGDVGGNLGGVLKSLGGFVEMISKIAEESEITRSGEIDTQKEGLRAVYGFSVRMGGRGQPRVEPFGNVKVGEKGTVVREVREPLIDVFDEEDHVLVVAELPGVDAKNIEYDVREDVLEIRGAQRDRRYQKEVLLPARCDGARATTSSHNGVFELKLPKSGR